ncbi:preprotein translocase subunit SecA [Elusimicrobiota bacterium]
MLGQYFQKYFGTKSGRDIKLIYPIVEKINSFEEEIAKLAPEDFPKKTAQYKEKIANGTPLDDLLHETFAIVREASKRSIGLRHFDVQMIGGVILHQGKISEMQTGEGKTLVSTLPAYLNALTGKGVIIVTVNDYLAKRDRDWMAPIYEYLGLTVGYVEHDMPNRDRRAGYACDITYVTNNELGFDYLRDNMVIRKEDRVLRSRNYAIVDEVDNILIDEARTPLIISGPSQESTQKYAIVNRLIPHFKIRFITESEEVKAKFEGVSLEKGFDAIVDEKNHNATITEEGVKHCEQLLGVANLYDEIQSEWVHHITQAIRAHYLFKKDVHYVVKEGEVVIVDEFTGRLMPGRQWSDGLHQAIEAKEHLQIKEENQTLATITFQNFFKLFSKLAGMTGTAMTEAPEFWSTYKLDVVEIPTNKPMIRIYHPDCVYRTEREKLNAVTEDIESCWKKGQPVLVGTRSIEMSERVATMLGRKGIPHQVLNAKHHESEAQIIAQAGKKAGVTIATNMAGRGTDIILGGKPPDEQQQKDVLSLGGLYILGTERHESRRIDNQLRGRSGRQGDPGGSRFYVSLEDELMRLFGSERIAPLLEKLGMQEGEVIEHPWVSKSIASAQKKVEMHHFDIRKQLLEYDNVMNKQREAIYSLRNSILDGENVTPKIQAMITELIEEKVTMWCPAKAHPEKWDLVLLLPWLTKTFGMSLSINDYSDIKEGSFKDDLLKEIDNIYKTRESAFNAEGFAFKELERTVLLQVIDVVWKEHLHTLDHIKHGIGLRAYGQKDPLIEYQKECFRLFEDMMTRIRDEAVEFLFRIPPPSERAQRPVKPKKVAAPVVSEKSKIGRNDPCTCGSGKKYKKCCGK